MRTIFFAVFIISIVRASGQSFVVYKDSINHFSINVPSGWKYGVNKNYPGLKMVAYRLPSGSSDTSRDNFNINIIETPSKTLDKTFSDFLKYLPDAKNYKLLDTGNVTFNEIKFKWLIETHANEKNNIQMHNYDFVTLKDGKTFILTLATYSYAFDSVKPLFDKIASTFTLLN